MGRHSDYKKLTSFECHYCDWCTCQKVTNVIGINDTLNQQ